MIVYDSDIFTKNTYTKGKTFGVLETIYANQIRREF